MSGSLSRARTPTFGALALGLLLAALAPPPAAAQLGTENAEWRWWGGDLHSTRYSPADQITPENFEELEVAWIWRGDNYGPEPDRLFRATPTYVDGTLYTVAGLRRTVVAIDPATGETLWTFREPETTRWERSPRKNYGKGVVHAEVDGRGVIYVVTPAFFLHALDAETGYPLEGWGEGVPIDGFPETGSVDLLAHMDEGEYDVESGYPEDHMVITNSSPPIIVDETIVVSNSHEQGYHQYHESQVPGDILAFDTRTGDFKWRFDVVPEEGQFGLHTWENDAWQHAGNVSSWAPMSADPELGLVYIVTDGLNVDFYKGFAPGSNLFSTSIIALDAETGERAWHFQTVHHDIWNFDNPTAPILLDVEVDGEEVPILAQATKQGWLYVLNRETGEPVWPIEERTVPEGNVPGEWYSPTQPFPTHPAPYEMQGLTEDDLIDFTPELKAEAEEILSEYISGDQPFVPPALPDPDRGTVASVHCPGSGGGTNIPGGAVADPTSGDIYVASVKGCTAPRLEPADQIVDDATVRWSVRGTGGIRGPRGLPIFKPPYGRVTAIDMNSGEHRWWVPNGTTPERIANHPALEEVDVGNTGTRSHATQIATPTMLIHGEGRGGRPLLHAMDKETGEILATVELPGATQGPGSTFVHEGEQYITFGVASRELPGSIVALKLP